MNDLGGDAQYGSDRFAALGYPEFEGPTYDNTCPSRELPPSARILSPANARTFKLHQRVPTRFTCTEAPGGPGIASCKDSNGRTSPGALNTSTVGQRTYTVTARSKDWMYGHGHDPLHGQPITPPVAVLSPLTQAAPTPRTP